MQKFWINASSVDATLMPKGLRNGLHIVEADVGKKWVTVRRSGASRGRRIPRLRWDRLPTLPFTGQTFGEVFLMMKGYTDASGKRVPKTPSQVDPGMGVGEVPKSCPIPRKRVGAA